MLVPPPPHLPLSSCGGPIQHSVENRSFVYCVAALCAGTGVDQGGNKTFIHFTLVVMFLHQPGLSDVLSCDCGFFFLVISPFEIREYGMAYTHMRRASLGNMAILCVPF